VAAPHWCASCRTELPPGALVCPACLRLVQAETLTRLADEAQALEAAGDGPAALERWRQALALLPAGTRQGAAVHAAVARLAAVHRPAPAASEPPPWLRWLGPLGVALLAGWKLIGVAKFASLLSLVAFFGVYLAELGWQYAAGLVLSIYLHELGHVLALRRAGIPSSPPMFIPGVGAYVRMHAAPKDAATDAAVGLAGPAAGLAAALAAQALWLATGQPIFRAVAHSGAVINLFNLTPVWQLDGARGLAPLDLGQRLALLVVAVAALALSGERILWLFVLFGAFRAFTSRAAPTPHQRTFAAYAALLAALAWLSAAAGGPHP
jgi:Zn-dependent protease